MRAIMIIICSLISIIKHKIKPPSPTATHSLLVARPKITRINPLSLNSCPSWQPGRQSRLALMPVTTISNDFRLSKHKDNYQLNKRHNGSVGVLADKSHLLANKYIHTLNHQEHVMIRYQGRVVVSAKWSTLRFTNSQ